MDTQLIREIAAKTKTIYRKNIDDRYDTLGKYENLSIEEIFDILLQSILEVLENESGEEKSNDCKANG